MTRASSPRAAALLSAIWPPVWPPLSLALAVLIATSAGQTAAATTPALLPVLVIFYWARHQPAQARTVKIPFWFSFACGLFVDIYAHGPLGYWALTYLIGAQLAAWASSFSAGKLELHVAASAFVQTLALAVSLAALTALQALISWCFEAHLPSLSDAALSMLSALVLYPVLALLLHVAANNHPAAGTSLFGRRERP